MDSVKYSFLSVCMWRTCVVCLSLSNTHLLCFETGFLTGLELTNHASLPASTPSQSFILLRAGRQVHTITWHFPVGTGDQAPQCLHSFLVLGNKGSPECGSSVNACHVKDPQPQIQKKMATLSCLGYV